ncbi:hypothetical protein SAMN04489735_100256 [Aneurinibacillus thermoaerophilus]|uniref:Uncharacterized protein n=1 Tax=Aneurinibacillus thermoaerophilus TaxID=143495 RepID=A0A1G7WPY0_ANETH|nr:hypothetical protein [Aneurinibacillus thermoaerophilus]SDG74045.1 hypothetical protein SAMN04489735_100256 [Aneurinibacillus thermoaerophilus]
MNTQVNDQVLENLPANVRQAIEQAVEMTKLEMWRNLRIKTPVDHGRAANSWQMQVVNPLEHMIYNTASYIKYLIEGTGEYGPTGRPIMPKTAGALKFLWKGKTFIFKGDLTEKWQKASFIKWAKEEGMEPVLSWPKGIKPHDFIDKSKQETEARIPEFVQTAIDRVMGS